MSELRSSSIADQVAAIPALTMTQLWALWDAYFDARPSHHHRTWLESRLAYKIQEHAYGGLKSAVRRKLELIGETGVMPSRIRKDTDRLLPGSILTRVYDDVEHRVLVRGRRDFEYNGQRFDSLSAIARKISGSQWSGPAFFGLRSKKFNSGFSP